MATIDVVEIVKTLQRERTQTMKEVAKLDKAIASLRELVGANSTPSANGRRRLSAAARKKIAVAQKARWAKFRKEQKAKA